jgi:hypothetical protein
LLLCHACLAPTDRRERVAVSVAKERSTDFLDVLGFVIFPIAILRAVLEPPSGPRTPIEVYLPECFDCGEKQLTPLVRYDSDKRRVELEVHPEFEALVRLSRNS